MGNKESILHQQGLDFLTQGKQSEGIATLEAAAVLSNAESMFTLGEIYRQGKYGIIISLEKAKLWHETAAKLSYAKSLIILSDYFSQELSITFLREAKGDLEALYTVAHKFLKNGGKTNIKEVIDCLITLGAQGHISSLLDLGKIYFMGELVEKSESLAKKYFTEASNRGNDFAAYALGGMESDLALALNYFDLAVKRGYSKLAVGVELYHRNTPAAKNHSAKYLIGDYDEIQVPFEVGDLYLNGYGVEKNIDLALKYFFSCMHDNTQALYKIGQIYLEHAPTVDSPELGYHYMLKAHEQKYVPASLVLAKIHMDPKSSKYSLEKAQTILETAQELGPNGNVSFLLGFIIETQNLPGTTPKAIKYYECALALDYTAAAYHLWRIDKAKCSNYVEIISKSDDAEIIFKLALAISTDEKDDHTALHLWLRAASLNYAPVYKHLGNHYLPINQDKAYEWYLKAFIANQINLSEFAQIFSQTSKQLTIFDFVLNQCTTTKNYDILKIFPGELLYKKIAK
ncbi:MAG: hypothetical protein Harvfovirus6_52 [Harvfovirus sp.]|uniref:Sel1 repeat family protein n=1 Tax=Harvfovirus sp. TaxID=2487768 RepID=A0A3G5A0U9_9VIRU|nr:MAG: hypothetical protein Harvfovirus6_52 [Harvfovirus sp.]